MSGCLMKFSFQSIELLRFAFSSSSARTSLRSKSTCTLFLYYRSRPLWRRTLHYSVIPSQLASFRSRRTYWTLNIQDGTLALISARHVTRSTTCTIDTVLIISVNCASRAIDFSTDNPTNRIQCSLFFFSLFLESTRRIIFLPCVQSINPVWKEWFWWSI